MNRRTVLLSCLGLLIAAPLAISVLSRYRASSEQRLAREAGIPLTPAQFSMPKVAAADDAAPVYAELSALLKRRPVTAAETRTLRSVGGDHARPDAELLAHIRRILGARRDALTLVHRAAGKPAAAFPVDFRLEASTVDTPVPGSALRTAGYLLRAEAASLAAEGRWDEAVRTQALELRMASHAASAPFIIAHLIGIAIDKDATRGMGDLLTWAGPNERVCRSVIRATEANRPRYDLPRTLKGEYLSLTATLRATWRQVARERDREVPLPRGWAITDALKSEHSEGLRTSTDILEADLLHYMRLLILAASLPMPQRQEAVLRVRAQLPREGRLRPRLLSAAIVPTLCKVPARETEAEAQRAVTLAAAEALIVVARTGRPPSTAPWSGRSEATARRIDPWTGGPIAYRRETDVFVVYSVGQHGSYDGRPLGRKQREARFAWRRQPN